MLVISSNGLNLTHVANIWKTCFCFPLIFSSLDLEHVLKNKKESNDKKVGEIPRTAGMRRWLNFCVKRVSHLRKHTRSSALWPLSSTCSDKQKNAPTPKSAEKAGSNHSKVHNPAGSAAPLACCSLHDRIRAVLLVNRSSVHFYQWTVVILRADMLHGGLLLYCSCAPCNNISNILWY